MSDRRAPERSAPIPATTTQPMPTAASGPGAWWSTTSPITSVETRRLRMLADLERLGSMRAVADELGVTTSTVSQQIAALARETGAVLLEPVGRQVRLTPAGRRLAEHAVTILAAVDAAMVDLDPGADPAGTVRVAGFATAIRRTLLPAVADLAVGHPDVRLLLLEHEPEEALALLADDAVDLALVYDYDLAPRTFDRTVDAVPLWSTPWSLGVPDDGRGEEPPDSVHAVAAWSGSDWIANSRNTADEDVVRILGSLAGVRPVITHRADSLDLVQDLVLAGLGVGLLPSDAAVAPGIRLLPLRAPDLRLRCYAATHRGRAGWAPLRLLLDRLTSTAQAPSAAPRAPRPPARRG